MSENVLLEFKRTTFHPWPFDYYGRWRGFISKSHVKVTNEEVIIGNNSPFKIADIEFCNVKRRWFGIGNSQVTIGVYDSEWQGREENKKIYERLLKRDRENEEDKDEASDTENAKYYGWQGRLFSYLFRSCYLNKSEASLIVKALKDNDALCFRGDNVSVGRGNRTLWINEERAVGSRNRWSWRGWPFGISTKDIEFASVHRRLFGLVKPRFFVGVADFFSFKNNWVGFDYCRTICSSEEIKMAQDFLQSQDAICYSEGSSVVTTHVPKWKVWRLIFTDTDSVWMNKRHIISDRNVYWWMHGIIIPQVKFFYTKGIFSNDLYLGARSAIRVDNITSNDRKLIEQHLKENGAKIALDTFEEYHDVFTFGDISHVKNWFARSAISTTESGIKMMQKTFKTTDDIYLPFDKINYAEIYGNKFLSRTCYLRIYGEQHIMPLRKYRKSDAKAIMRLLESHGVRSVEGEKFTSSYHDSWVGLLISIVTLSIWHWIVVFFTSSKKRSGLAIDTTQKKAAWEGPLYVVWEEKDEDPVKDKSSKLTFEVSDLDGVKFYKKHWYHLWGHLVFWVSPYSFRVDQLSKDYWFLLGKCWSWNAHRLINRLKDCGHSNDYDKKKNRYLKWRYKYLLNQKEQKR